MTTCGDCNSTGWRYVSRAYAEHEAKQRMAQGENPRSPLDDPADFAKWVEYYESTVYPCRTCNAETFYRWSGGHLDRDHDRAGCTECRGLGVPIGRGSGRRRKVHAGGGGEEPPPPDEPPADYASRAAGDF